MTAAAAGDQELMALALAAARRGDYRTSPNPMVGCVIVRDGEVVATGWHEVAGGPHAEVAALSTAGARARGADVYLTLEPCTRHGRTPPCVDALLEVRPRRLVCAMLDPNPAESGRGVARLRAAGIDVTVGVSEDEARKLNDFYAHHVSTGRPFVTAKFAASLDGKAATASGRSQWITSPEARQMAHRLRHQHDAVMVGSGTVIADDPRLTARISGARQATRVIVDSTLRLPSDATIIREHPERTLLATTPRAPAPAVERFRELGVRVEVVQERDGRVDLEALLERLGQAPLISLLVEGGPTLLGALFDARLVRRVVAMLSPRLLGGDTARGAVGGRGVDDPGDAPLLRDVSVERCGPDLVVTGYCGDGAS